MARKNKASKKSFKVNFKGVDGFSKMEEGENLLTITDDTSVEDGEAGPYIKIVAVDENDARVYHNVSFSKNSLGFTRAFLEAAGIDPPEEDTDLSDIRDELVDKTFMAQIEHETYEGKKRPRIVDYWAADGESSGGKEKDDTPDFDEMDEDGLKKFIKKNKLDVDPDDFPKEKKLRKAVAEAYEAANSGDAKESEEIDVDELDEKQIKKLIKSKELDVDPDDYPKLPKLRKAVAKALEEAGEGDDDKPSEDEIKEMDSDGLQEVIDKHELDVDLDDIKTLRKQQKAVIEALAE